MSREALAVFARAPEAGRVKSRLARDIGIEAAAALYAAMLRDVLATAASAMRERGGICWVAHTPDEAFFPSDGASLRPFWGGPRMPQGEGDVGERMLRCLHALREGRHGARSGVQRAVIIGSDSPDLPPHLLHAAFEALKRHDLVFGPSGDGGFYLIGASRRVPEALFADVEWSAPTTLQAVLHNARRLELSVAQLAGWDDVDTLGDLRALARRLTRRDALAPATAAWLESSEWALKD